MVRGVGHTTQSVDSFTTAPVDKNGNWRAPVRGKRIPRFIVPRVGYGCSAALLGFFRCRPGAVNRIGSSTLLIPHSTVSIWYAIDVNFSGSEDFPAFVILFQDSSAGYVRFSDDRRSILPQAV